MELLRSWRISSQLCTRDAEETSVDSEGVTFRRKVITSDNESNVKWRRLAIAAGIEAAAGRHRGGGGRGPRGGRRPGDG
jgi:hypothetical protein